MKSVQQPQTNEELKGKTPDVQKWKKMGYDILMVGKINLNSLVRTELRYSIFFVFILNFDVHFLKHVFLFLFVKRNLKKLKIC